MGAAVPQCTASLGTTNGAGVAVVCIAQVIKSRNRTTPKDRDRSPRWAGAVPNAREVLEAGMVHAWERVYDGLVVAVDRCDYVANGASLGIERVWHPGGAACVAVGGDRQVCLLRQYRPVAGDWLWELPAGKRDREGEGWEPSRRTAQRELAEEAGVHAEHWYDLGEIWPSPGVFGEVVALFLAEGLTAVPSQHEPGEQIEVHWLPLDEACRRALSGQLDDAKTVIGLLRAQQHLSER